MQKTIMDKKTIKDLREELVQEKLKSQQITNELEQLRSDLHRMGLDKDKLEADVSAADEHRLKALQEMMEDARKQSLSIKEEKIKTLEQNLEETKNLNATLHRQLDTMQKEYQSYLDRKQSEPSTNTTTINVQATPGKQSSSISQLVIKKTPQQGPVQQIQSEHYLAVQHELMKGQRQIATLKSENAGLKSHSMYSEERAKKLETNLAVVKGEKNSLNAQNAQLQVENTTLQSQSNSLLKQNSRLQQKLAKLQSDFEETAVSHQELNETYESLVQDHEQLQSLNEQLSSEYEALISEHGMLKSQYKQQKEEMAELNRSKHNLAKEKAAIEEMRQSMHKERLSLQLDDSFSFNQDMKRLSEEKQLFQQQTDKMRGEYRDLLSEYKNVKTEYNQLKLKHTELNGDMADCRDQLNKLDIQNAKLVNKCEALERQNTKLEEENKQLLFQLQALLQQNQELLSQTLETSEHFREEESIYRDKLAHVTRAKEKLEEKIMDQYKNLERSNKKKGIGAVLVKKAKGFINKRSRDAARRQTIAGINYISGTSESIGQSAASKSCTQCNSCSKVPQKNSEGKLMSRKDLTKSQLDLVYGSESVEDSRSLSGVSIGSKGSSRGSEDIATGPSEFTLSKSNKVINERHLQVRLRRSRVKAQSIENLFDSQSAGIVQKDEPVSAFHTPHTKRLSSDIRPESNKSTLYNSAVSHHLSSDHRKIAVSTTALNVSGSVGPLREVSLVIPVDELYKENGARSSDDLLSSQNDSSVSSPMSSNRSDRIDNSYKSSQKNGGIFFHHQPLSQRSSTGERRRQMWLYDYAGDSDDDGRSLLSNRSSEDQFPTKDCDDLLPTKDVGFRNSESLKSSASSNSLSLSSPPLYISVYLSSPPLYTSVYLSSPPLYTSVYLSSPPLYISVYLSSPPLYISVYLSSPPLYISVYLSSPPLYTSVYLSSPPLYTSVYLSQYHLTSLYLGLLYKPVKS
ncbi:hypothetical protein EB796_003243 [Bugula neritina]|uniref:Uncharacterized protein n=1 Tax=Bugula neritina TaxID=10212 RepID=A0A7J7KIE1_BUGNE|nr:hypothetical protein EB796_003243 [Bugula neritina]